MAKELPVTGEYVPGLIDPGNEGRCKLLKVVDVTEDCPAADATDPYRLLFTRMARGRTVQIIRMRGGRAWFLVDNPDGRDELFARWAETIGLTVQQLRKLITDNAPS